MKKSVDFTITVDFHGLVDDIMYIQEDIEEMPSLIEDILAQVLSEEYEAKAHLVSSKIGDVN